MKLKKLAGTILFFILLILLWQLLYTAACDWFDWAKPYAITVQSESSNVSNGSFQKERSSRR